jgi:hypothetical protein
VHAVTLLVVLLVAAPLASFIPLPVLAAILFVVSVNMGEWHEIPRLLVLTKTDISVWLVTFALTSRPGAFTACRIRTSHLTWPSSGSMGRSCSG